VVSERVNPKVLFVRSFLTSLFSLVLFFRPWAGYTPIPSASRERQAHQRTFAPGSQNQHVTAKENIYSSSQIFKKKKMLRTALISGSVPFGCAMRNAR
jgi:hypothetical protein